MVPADNVSDTHKRSETWQATVTRAQDGVVERLPTSILVQLGHALRPLIFALHLLNEAKHGVEVTIVTVTYGALLGQLGVTCASRSQLLQLHGSRNARVVKGNDKVVRVGLHCTNGFGASVNEGLGHGWLVRRLGTTVHGVVGCLERHLYECVWRELRGEKCVSSAKDAHREYVQQLTL